MSRARVIMFLLLSLPAAEATQHQSPSGAPPGKSASLASASQKQPPADESREPFVIERYATTARFEEDGTGEQDLSVRIHVQSAAGAQQLHQLAFGYDSASEQMDVRFVRVHKSDSTVVEADASAIKDTIAPIAGDAPAFSDHRQKQVTVPPLAPGDTLEYEVATQFVTPLAPREFWFQHNFLDSAVVLDEQLEVSVPDTRKVEFKSSARFPYDTDRSGGRVLYRWKHANLTPPADDSAKKGPEKIKPPDVQLTTFASWQDVARWYAKLERGHADPTPEIRAKTQELIHGRTTELAKMRALYEYVSSQIRYVELPFGTGSCIPHSAAEIFANKYGDAKDKHTLLAAMLQSAGIPADAVLIPYTTKLDRSLPSPGQFDHLITAVPRGAAFIWMDSTTGVAPFRLLASPLRGKSALIVPTDGAGSIVETPADPPFLSTQHVDIDGQVSELGKLAARAHYALRGDTELVLRLAFHRTPQSQWNELGQTILTLDGIHGEVTSVKPGDPAATQNPFELDIDFTQSNFLDWSAKREKAALPLLAIGLPDPPADAAKPIQLGSPLNVTVRLKLGLPPSFSAEPPVAVSVTRDYAEFKSNYQFASHLVTAERSLDFKMRELPASRANDYAAFLRAVTADENQPLTVISTALSAPAVPPSAKTDELLEAGLAALNAGNPGSATPLFERATQLEPSHKSAWIDLGLAYLRAGRLDEAVSAFRKQLEIDPEDAHANDYLGLALERQQKIPEAAAAFRNQTEVNPLDPAAHAALGEILLQQHDDAHAASELDKATILSPENAELQVSLGRAYLNTGDRQKALGAFEKAGALSPTPLVWNDIAFDLADSRVELDKAQKYADSAVTSIATDLSVIDWPHLTAAQLDKVASLAACWDTLGWVYAAKGGPQDLQKATDYVSSAWLLDQNGEIGDHLAQIYEKLGMKDRAIHAYALALAAPNSLPETRARLTLLLGGNSQIDDLVNNARPELNAMNSYKLKGLGKEDGAADFLILLSKPAAGGSLASVEAVKFADGSAALRPLADRLRTLDYGATFPGATPAKLVRRGTLACSATTGDCIFTLMRPEDVRAAP
ncbi:MAG TPA: DUF3857 domain-containing protein [Candidatus Acidoferrales bacterium]|nr:DUF3857 domain-containing protein [Candidatus Acidoferrales bacterium]